ncbi:peptide chain release factor N(5)-glutamine methyltransferase [Sphingomonas cannabina]|uniref:peptide chain release factor N(5)-glutamine methyltransferase n=1 Tax=Sphingomonas cannabina TaxID=2899123 RepID=UPI001F4257EB|nr:peptide chain release factor N(5)-glutamine methyltransferase [Sphingomonas cannabina]UIJ47446.1 peptide chain release factor N(5)-glutamine methyltransferase [Sphingomonas cannabina]
MARAAEQFTFSETPRLDAELLMAHALGTTRDEMLLRGLIDTPAPPAFAELAARRAAHEPIAYILGKRDFWTIELQVGPGALVPRADSETLIEAAVDHFKGTPGPARVLDLGTGPGTLLLAALAEWPQAAGLGVDSSSRALTWAWRNVASLGMSGRARFVLGDWAARIADSFDLILANPPYIGTAEPLPAEVREHEPASALFAGADGLDAYRAIVPHLPRLLAPGGVAILEIGWTQADTVTALVETQGLAATLRRDLAGHPRAILAA